MGRETYLRFGVACVAALALVLAVRVALPRLRGEEVPAAPPQPAGFVGDQVTYELDRRDPSRIAWVRFRLLPARPPATLRSVQVKLISTASSFTTCRPSGTDRSVWECPVAGVAARAADRLEVVVNQEAPAVRRLYLPLIRGATCAGQSCRQSLPLIAR
jgi:hypothetical protein